MSLRETVKRIAPAFARQAFIATRAKFGRPPAEDVVLHEYSLVADPAPEGRLNLVIPSIATRSIFGGVATGLDFLFFCARALNFRPRIVIDEFNDATDLVFVSRAAYRSGFSQKDIEYVRRTAVCQPIEVRRNDLFLAYNWWVALNLRGLLAQQQAHFESAGRRPLIYLVQEYEPAFYGMSSTHMLARAAFDGAERTFGVFNSKELHAYFRLQGHSFEREFVFSPRMSRSLKEARSGAFPPKQKTILVYGRPMSARNCFPAVVSGLKAFLHSYPEFNDWAFQSAGAAHASIALGRGKVLRALGKLSTEDYARTLDLAAVGLSLMASPHPSYPPLEMAHFGVRTITNDYPCKDLSGAHENIKSVRNILPETIAEALAGQCRAFLADPEAGWHAKSMMPDYLADEQFPFMEEFVAAIRGSEART